MGKNKYAEDTESGRRCSLAELGTYLPTDKRPYLQDEK